MFVDDIVKLTKKLSSKMKRKKKSSLLSHLSYFRIEICMKNIYHVNWYKQIETRKKIFFYYFIYILNVNQ